MKLTQTLTGRATILRALLVILALALTLAATSAASAGRPDDPSPGKAEERGREFQSLEEAVAAGKLDTELVTGLGQGGKVEGIVTFESAAILDEAEQAAPKGQGREGAILKHLRPAFAAQKARAFEGMRGEFEVITDYDSLAVSFARFGSQGALLAVLNKPDVTGVRANRSLAPSTMDAQSKSLIRADTAHLYYPGYKGAGTYVAVIDTGVDFKNADFGSCSSPNVPLSCKVFFAHKYASGNYRDFCAVPEIATHGTNVAGIVVGVAPGTRIFDLNVFHTYETSDWFEPLDCSAHDSDILAAIADVIKWKPSYNIRAMNLSLGSGGHYRELCADSVYLPVFAEARRLGILPVVAAGNDGFTAEGTDGVASPACTPGAVSVGAVYDGNVGAQDWRGCSDSATKADQVTCFSQTGPTLSLLAPGACITAAGVPADGSCAGGTSQAAPHVAGAAALLASARPTATADAIQWALVNNGAWVQDSRNGQWNRRLDVYSALYSLLNRPADTTAPVATAPIHSIPTTEPDYDTAADAWHRVGTSAASTIPVRISWSAIDRGGIAQYALQYRVNSGLWTDLTLKYVGQTTGTWYFGKGNTYEFRVAAKDLAGKWSPWAQGAPFTLQVHQESSSAISYPGGAWELAAESNAFGGYERVARKTNSIIIGGGGDACAKPFNTAMTRFTFRGKQVAWIAPTSPLGGEFVVFLDGSCVGRFSLYDEAKWTWRRTMFTLDADPTRDSTLEIYALTSTGQIDSDAFVVLK